MQKMKGVPCFSAAEMGAPVPLTPSKSFSVCPPVTPSMTNENRKNTALVNTTQIPEFDHGGPIQFTLDSKIISMLLISKYLFRRRL